MTAFAPKSSIVVPSRSFQTNPTESPSTAQQRAYKARNVIERCFYGLEDFRRVATRYDKLARNLLAQVHLTAIVAYGSIKLNPSICCTAPTRIETLPSLVKVTCHCVFPPD